MFFGTIQKVVLHNNTNYCKKNIIFHIFSSCIDFLSTEYP